MTTNKTVSKVIGNPATLPFAEVAAQFVTDSWEFGFGFGWDTESRQLKEVVTDSFYIAIGPFHFSLFWNH